MKSQQSIAGATRHNHFANEKSQTDFDRACGGIIGEITSELKSIVAKSLPGPASAIARRVLKVESYMTDPVNAFLNDVLVDIGLFSSGTLSLALCLLFESSSIGLDEYEAFGFEDVRSFNEWKQTTEQQKQKVGMYLQQARD